MDQGGSTITGRRVSWRSWGGPRGSCSSPGAPTPTLPAPANSTLRHPSTTPGKCDILLDSSNNQTSFPNIFNFSSNNVQSSSRWFTGSLVGPRYWGSRSASGLRCTGTFTESGKMLSCLNNPHASTCHVSTCLMPQQP